MRIAKSVQVSQIPVRPVKEAEPVLQQKDQTIVDERKHELLKARQKQTKAQTKRLEKVLIEMLTTEHLSGMPVGMINYKSYIHTRLPTLREDVEKNVRKITENLNAD